MKYLALLFFGMFLYGILYGHVGAGLLALGVGIFVMYADIVFAMQEERWHKDPRNATTEPCTAHKLTEHCCICSGSEL